MMPGKITFPPNVPVDLALQHAEGMRVPSDYGDGYQILYTTVDGRKAYFSPTVAAKIAALKPETGQLLRITKRERPDGRKGFIWDVEKLGEQGDGTYVLPKATGPATAPAIRQPGTGEQSDRQNLTPVPRPPTSSVVSHARRLIDLHAECMSYAERYGAVVTREDVRTYVTTAYIQGGRSGQLRRVG
jgi:hypothetical protein